MMNRVNDIMKHRENIRNISIIAHVDHGKTALTESLTHVHMDVGEEKERGITIKSAAVSLPLSRFEKNIKREYLINLIDSPGHVDFSSEVTAALRITDGAICVIDCIEGGKTQTETVLRQAILELVKPVLFINKIDRIWLEKHLSLNETYKEFKNTIEWTNAICQTYKDDILGDIEMNPSKLNVGFGSGYFSYGFTVNHFAKMYSSQFGLSERKMNKKLWGNHYYDSINKKWIKKDKMDENNLNAFCKYILKPIQVLHDAIMSEQHEVYIPIINALGLNITNMELNKCEKPKEVLKLVMSRWLPTRQCVLDLCADNLPSPIVAQKYRIPRLYTGPLDTKEAQDMMLCSNDGALSMYVSKMIPIEKDPGRFIAFGRVFSGTIKRGQELRILGQNTSSYDDDDNDYNYDEDENEEKTETKIKVVQNNGNRKKVQGIMMMMGSKQVTLSECSAGNICGLMGIDKQLTKSGTLCNSQQMFPFKTMKFSVSPVVNVAVNVVDQKNLNKLIEGLQRLSKYDNIIQITQNKQKQHIIAGSGELHLQTCLNTLKEKFLGKNVKIATTTPIVSFCEGIDGISGSTQTLPPNIKQNHKFTYPKIIIAKSPNKLNRIYLSAEPLSEEVCIAIENDKIKLKSDMKTFGREFAKKFTNWHKHDAAKIWSFGCPPYGKANILVDQTKAVDYLDKVKSSIIEGFRQITSGGILADEPLRGVRFNILDAKIHSDPSHHGAGQIIPAMVRACYGALLASTPCLYEPMYEVNIEVPIDSQNGIFNTFGKVRGEYVKMLQKPTRKNMCIIIGYVPILETLKNVKENKIGFTELLRQNTQGKAFASMKFSHWQKVDGDALIIDSISNKFMMDIRRRKQKMKLEIPSFTDYHDKI